MFLPETIGAIAYAAKFSENMKNVDLALVPTTVGGPGKLGYKQSFVKDHFVHDLIDLVLSEIDSDYVIYPFDIHGSDEEQYSSPGLRIPTVSITKDKYYEYDYYHCSLDDLNFVKPEYLETSLTAYMNLIVKSLKVIRDMLEPNHVEKQCFQSMDYPEVGGAILPGQSNVQEKLDQILNLLFCIDGEKSVLEIAKELDYPFELVCEFMELFLEKDIIKRVYP